MEAWANREESEIPIRGNTHKLNLKFIATASVVEHCSGNTLVSTCLAVVPFALSIVYSTLQSL